MKIGEYFVENHMIKTTSKPYNYSVEEYADVFSYFTGVCKYSYTNVTRLCNVVESLKEYGLTNYDIMVKDSHELTEAYTGVPYRCRDSRSAAVNRLISLYQKYLKISEC